MKYHRFYPDPEKKNLPLFVVACSRTRLCPLSVACLPISLGFFVQSLQPSHVLPQCLWRMVLKQIRVKTSKQSNGVPSSASRECHINRKCGQRTGRWLSNVDYNIFDCLTLRFVVRDSAPAKLTITAQLCPSSTRTTNWLTPITSRKNLSAQCVKLPSHSSTTRSALKLKQMVI